MDYRLPAEFEPQSFVQLIFPHPDSDWAPYLEEASHTFVSIATTIASYQSCLIICDDIARVKAYFHNSDNIFFVTASTNDTWARDCSAITTINTRTNTPKILDFTFTGWGNKFESERDNALTSHLKQYYNAPYQKERLILEGGAIESNGEGLLLTTQTCLLNPNRNTKLTQKSELETILKTLLGIEKTLWLDHGFLEGDDTDSHIDTLARFVNKDTIAYVQCNNPDDIHYHELQAMERELHAFTDQEGTPLHLIPLPMCDPIYFEGERLPATYANFLIINNAVLVPTYNDPHDQEALNILTNVFKNHDVIGIDCSVLIRQHGSLHCVTMQFPEALTLI
ncbi:MAG TPA: agmatine deiminase family protein [Helicobacteraceae bacterium]|nr:agmatine deiminase family protein [Helicobacteraceae bacterium]